MFGTSNLLNKRLARSLWGTKLRLSAVIGMIFVGVFAGITFGGYSANLGPMYDSIYEDSDSGSNLADIWIDNETSTWSGEQVQSLCSEIESSWPEGAEPLDQCEGRIVMNGAMFHMTDSGQNVINSVWHGIPHDSDVDKAWFPDGHSQGMPAEAEDEIVIDEHVREALSLSLQDVVTIGVGEGSMNFTIVGFAYHPLHIYMAPEGSLFPPESGEFVVGYLSSSGMERLTGLSQGSANTIVLDISGTPSFDLSDTEAYEGEELDGVKEAITSSMDENGMDGRIRDRGQVESVELMRLDLEGSKTMAAPFTILIQLIAAITIALSLQRLVQSQTREIAILRTLGLPRKSIMSGYLMAPLVIGGFGCLLGSIAGPYGMNGMLDFYEGIVGIPIICLILTGCAGWNKTDASKTPVNAQERARKNVEEGKGASIAGLLKRRGGGSFEFSSSNPMWRATLGTLDFLPLTTVDYSGGVVITDWYSDNTNNKSIKITVRFLSNEIKSSSLKIMVHQKVCKSNNVCSVNLMEKSKIREELNAVILRKAALLEKEKKQIK